MSGVGGPPQQGKIGGAGRGSRRTMVGTDSGLLEPAGPHAGETGDPFDEETRRAGMAASMGGHVGLRRGEGSGLVTARFVAPPRR